MMRSAILKRLLVSALLPASLSLSLTGCFTLKPGTFAPPTTQEVGPVLDNYGQAVIPLHGLIVAQGDDLIYGVAEHSRRPGINGSTAARTSTTITETLRETLHGVTIVNQGYPGDTVAQGAQRWADAPAGNLMILSYGYGDAEAKTPPAEYARVLRQMVRRARAQGAAVFLIPTPPMAATPAPPAGKTAKSGKMTTAPPILTTAEIEPYRAAMRVVGAEEGAEVFEPQAEIVRDKDAPTKTIAQSPEIYQAIAGGMVPYIRIVQPAKTR